MSFAGQFLTPVRVFLFCGFYEHSTWLALKDGLGHIPSWSTFSADLPLYETILHRKSFIHGQPLYTSRFQLVPPTKLFGVNSLPHYAATLRFVKSLMDSGLPDKLTECRYAVDASNVLRTFPTLGAFLSLNLLCCLDGVAGIQFSFRDFASCGPGSRSYLQRIFGMQINTPAAEDSALKWLQTNQWEYWTRLKVDPPHTIVVPGLRPGLRCLDFENAACWCHRYVAQYTKNDWKSIASLPIPPVLPHDTAASAPAWCEEEKHAGGRSEYAENHDQTNDMLPPMMEGEDVYEVEKVVGRKGNKSDRDGLFRIRWRGYQPEEDTWERASQLTGASEVSAMFSHTTV